MRKKYFLLLFLQNMIGVKRYVLLILTLSLFLNNLFAQTEKLLSKTIAARFENFYNKGNYDSIFYLFSQEMQKYLPLEKTTKFFTDLKSGAGNITKRQFIKYDQTAASYKTNFERALFAVNISVTNQSKINGLLVKPFTDETLPTMEHNSSKLQLPFKGEWTVVWGGDTKELNYHVESKAQKNAFDIVITGADGKSYKTTGKTNNDYYAFSKELLAPCNGEVVLVVDGIKDNKPAELNPIYVPGNTVIIRTSNNEYLFFAHFKQHSITVKQGQKVIQGQLLGLCGNSGNSSEPHLHFHIQNVGNMNVATGIKCYFDKLIVNGQVRRDYSPIQKDKIRTQ